MKTTCVLCSRPASKDSLCSWHNSKKIDWAFMIYRDELWNKLSVEQQAQIHQEYIAYCVALAKAMKDERLKRGLDFG